MTKPVRAVFFLPSLAGGGAQRALIHIANGFESNGVPTALLVGSLEGEYRNEISNQIDLVNIGKKRVIACLPFLVVYLWRRKPKVLVATMMHANIVAVLAGILSFVGTRVVVRESNVLEVWNGKPLVEGKSLLLRIASLVYPYADKVVCVSAGVRESLTQSLKLKKANTAVIMNPIVSNDFFKKSNERSSVDAKDLPQRKYVVSVGRLAPVKGFDVLLRAFAEFQKSHDMDLLILGEGAERNSLEELARDLGIAENVYMPGFVVNPFPLLKQASLYVMSSRHEGLPNALIQAVALGCRVVVTEMENGPGEILDGDCYGVTVPMDDPVQMSRAMTEAIGRESWPMPDDDWFRRFSSDSIIEEYITLCGGDLKPH